MGSERYVVTETNGPQATLLLFQSKSSADEFSRIRQENSDMHKEVLSTASGLKERFIRLATAKYGAAPAFSDGAKTLHAYREMAAQIFDIFLPGSKGANMEELMTDFADRVYIDLKRKVPGSRKLEGWTLEVYNLVKNTLNDNALWGSFVYAKLSCGALTQRETELAKNAKGSLTVDALPGTLKPGQILSKPELDKFMAGLSLRSAGRHPVISLQP